jgi:fumarate hydratase class I
MIGHGADMRDIIPEILELIRLTSTSISPEIEDRLKKAMVNEERSSAAQGALQAILLNIEIARRNSTPICQDTGIPTYYVRYPSSWTSNEIGKQILNATALATKMTYLRPNAVNTITSENTGNNIGDKYFPEIHFIEVEGDYLSIDLILKGGGCENVGAQYSLPVERLNAARDLEGVRKVVLDAIYQAQGEGCAPGFLGVAIGGDRSTSYLASKEVLLQNFNCINPEEKLSDLEEQITKEANELGIGPMGFGGKTTILKTKITSTYRIPASFFVSVSYMCWAFRQRKLEIKGEQINYA